MAKRVNKPFLLGLLLVPLALGVVAILWQHFWHPGRGDLKKLLADGDRAYAAGEYEKARVTYAQATQADPTSTTALVKLGDASAKLGAQDVVHLQEAGTAWNRALSLNPRDTEAMTRLLDSYWDLIDLGVRSDEQASMLTKCREWADRLATVDPSNHKAVIRKHIATIRQWLLTRTVSVQEVNRSVREMETLSEKDPGDGELRVWISNAKIRQAQDLIDNGLSAQNVFDDLTAQWDKARKEQPKNAAIQFRAFQAYNQLSRVDPRTKDDPKDDRYRRRAGESIAAAQQVATDKDELYDDVHVLASRWALQQGDQEKAKQIVRAFYESHKDDQRARLEMARLLGSEPATRAEAIKILSQEVPEDKQATGFKAFKRQDLRAQTAYQLSLLRLADYTATEPAKRKELGPVIEAGIESLRKLTSPKHFWVLGLEGRYHLIRGEYVDAIRVLEEASKSMPAGDADFMYVIAQAELAGNQVGSGKWWLQRAVEAAPPSWLAPRLKLTDMLLTEGDVESAKRNLAVLQQQGQDDPAVKKLADRVLAMSRTGDPSRSADAFNAQPEGTNEQRTNKAHLAMQSNRPDEAIRLLRRNLEEDPKDARTPEILMEIYMSRGQRDRARQVIADALKQNPDVLPLQILSLRLSDLPADQVYARSKPLIEKTPDEGIRELQLFELERGPGGHADEALAHLEHAARLRRDDVRVYESLFGVYVTRKDWTKAEGVVKDLARLNADQCGGDLYRQRLAMFRGDYRGAEVLADRLVDQYPQFAATWLAQALARQGQARYEDAIRSYFEVRKRQPKHYEAVVGLVDCYYALNRPEEAKAILSEGHRLFPKDVALWNRYLDHLVAYDDPTQAIGDREQMAKDYPNDPAAQLGLATTYFQSARRLAPTDPNAFKDYWNKAYGTLQAGEARFPDDGRFYALQAEMLQYAGRPADGEKVLQDFARRPSVHDRPAPYLMIAEFYQRLGRPDLAEQALGDALTKSDANEAGEVRYRLSKVMAQNHKFPEALAVLDGIKPAGTLRTVRQRAEILIAAGDSERAKSEIDAALRQHDNPDLHALKASVLIDTGKVPEAMAEVAAALKADPRNEMAAYIHALALMRQARPDVDGAIKEMVDLRSRNPRNMQYRMVLADLYAGTGHPDTAARELAEGLEREPLNKPARLMLVQMYRTQQPPNLDAALRTCQLAEADPVLGGDPTWAREEAMIYALQKRVPEAILKMGVVCKMAPQNLDFQRERIDMILQFNDFDAVLRESDKLLGAGVDAWWLRDRRGRALALRQEPDVTQALVEFDKGLELADAAKNAAAAEALLRSMATSVARKGPDGKRVPTGIDEAIKRATARAGDDPDNRWRLLLASLYQGKGDFANAGKVVEAMMADPANKAPERRVHVLETATDYYRSGPSPDYARARAAFTELLALKPNDIASLNNFAYMLVESITPPEPAAAKQYSQRAYELSRTSGSPDDYIFDSHAWILILNGGADAAEGIKILEGVVKRQPDLIDAHYHLGEGYLRQPRPSKQFAKVELNKAMELVRKQEAAGLKVDKAMKDRIATALERATDGGEKTAQAPKGS